MQSLSCIRIDVDMHPCARAVSLAHLCLSVSVRMSVRCSCACSSACACACVSHIACCMLHVACCMLHIACCRYASADDPLMSLAHTHRSHSIAAGAANGDPAQAQTVEQSDPADPPGRNASRTLLEVATVTLAPTLSPVCSTPVNALHKCIACWMLHVACCMLHAACCILLMTPVPVGLMMYVACCMLHVAC